ncbi:trans-sialidase, partial [Trypanosoma rangeli]
MFGMKFDGTVSTRNRLGLLCSSENKWVVRSRTGERRLVHAPACESNKQYHVLLTLKDDRFFFYVNGESLTLEEGQNEVPKSRENGEITHFYFGADDDMSDADGSVTVKNVQLCDHPEHIVE